ncbi:MAG: class II fumarate hydratase [Candidatus Heimdallarchaeota archaeon]
MDFRIEKDVLGEIQVPANVYWGINTQRAIQNFQISGKNLPSTFILSLANVKKACLMANLELKLIDQQKADAILKSLDEILNEKKYLDQFPIDVFQTGSGTQTNMNMNEVVANRANEILGHPLGKKSPVHPNDDVNKCQSSNDVIPSAMHLSTIHLIREKLIPSLKNLKNNLDLKIKQFKDIIKVGRTHLQDAVPIPLSLEFEVYRKQIEISLQRVNNILEELLFIPIGGTVIGTGLNSHDKFSDLAVQHLSKITGYHFKSNLVKAEGIASHNTITAMSSVIRSLALSLLKMANDIRWMGSGPRAGLSELILPRNEPGSSIMPGKVNPTQSEALIQVCLQVIGNDTTITYAEGYGSILDLNVCKPLMISNLIESINLLSNAINSFISLCLNKIEANKNQINSNLERMLMVVTKLTPILGYDQCSAIAMKAYKEGKTIKETIREMGIKVEGDLDELLDPKKMV